MLGIIGEGRFYYWKALLRTIFRRPQYIHRYIRLAIYGYHFRKVFQPKYSKLEDLIRCGSDTEIEGLQTEGQAFIKSDNIRGVTRTEKPYDKKEVGSSHVRGSFGG
jgi:hypothetical protein